MLTETRTIGAAIFIGVFIGFDLGTGVEAKEPLLRRKSRISAGKTAVAVAPSASAGVSQFAQAIEPSEALEMPADSYPEGASCPGGRCPPYYRDRADYFKRKKNEGVFLNNRMNEPDWYKYYRCVHYGYHPTQWAPWPDGWLTCRNPIPGDHPYDIKPGISRRTLDKAPLKTVPADPGTRPRDSTDPGPTQRPSVLPKKS